MDILWFMEENEVSTYRWQNPTEVSVNYPRFKIVTPHINAAFLLLRCVYNYWSKIFLLIYPNLIVNIFLWIFYLLGLIIHITSRKGENRRKYSVRVCVAKRARRYAWHKGEKGDDFPDVRPSESLLYSGKSYYHIIVDVVHYIFSVKSPEVTGGFSSIFLTSLWMVSDIIPVSN